jgi:hypothetical protein
MADPTEPDRTAAPFMIKSPAGTIVGRYASSTDAVRALPAAKKATGCHCVIVS